MNQRHPFKSTPIRPTLQFSLHYATLGTLQAERFLRRKVANVADLAPADPAVTTYDEEHIVTYLRLLDADAEGADWRDVSRIVLHIDPDREPDQARRTFDSHLARAKWMTEVGYRHLLRGGASRFQ